MPMETGKSARNTMAFRPPSDMPDNFDCEELIESGPIDHALSCLLEAEEAMSALIAKIASRFGPVLLPACPTSPEKERGDGTTAPKPSCAVLNAITSIERRHTANYNYLASLIERCQL